MYIEAVTRFSHIHHPDGLSCTSLSQDCVLEQFLVQGRQVECTFLNQGRGWEAYSCPGPAFGSTRGHTVLKTFNFSPPEHLVGRTSWLHCSLRGAAWLILANEFWVKVVHVSCRLEHLLANARSSNSPFPSGIMTGIFGDQSPVPNQYGYVALFVSNLWGTNILVLG